MLANADQFVEVPRGRFLMGDASSHSYPADGEAPVRQVDLPGFSMSLYAVTNRQFAGFVDASDHVTDAERFGWSFVFGGHLPDDHPPTRGVVAAPWWRQVENASWKRPTGGTSSMKDRWDHPVVHVSYKDATACADFYGARLPTEAEWECAARAGASSPFPWGEALVGSDGVHRANVWQGVFPSDNTLEDGWYGTCPVDALPPNAWGLHNMIGNVWEWTADWFSVDRQRSCCNSDPIGETVEEMKTLKGGSYLCHESYCARYRPAARSASALESSSDNVGFRLAR